jgi:hypothetical protein
MKVGRGRHYRQYLINSDKTSCETSNNVDIFKIFFITTRTLLNISIMCCCCFFSFFIHLRNKCVFPLIKLQSNTTIDLKPERIKHFNASCSELLDLT